MWRCIPWLIGLCAAGSAQVAYADVVEALLPIRNGSAQLGKPIRTWKALQEDHIVMQRFDYSCGAAALATLFRHYFADEINEKVVLTGILSAMTPEDIVDRQENGFSLLDMKNFAVNQGYQAVGVKLKYASLLKLKEPVLIHLERDNYKHFAVLKGVRGDRVFLADPSRGNIRMSMERFAQEWTGVALVLSKHGFAMSANNPLALSDQAPIQDELLAAYRAPYSTIQFRNSPPKLP